MSLPLYTPLQDPLQRRHLLPPYLLTAPPVPAHSFLHQHQAPAVHAPPLLLQHQSPPVLAPRLLLQHQVVTASEAMTEAVPELLLLSSRVQSSVRGTSGLSVQFVQTFGSGTDLTLTGTIRRMMLSTIMHPLSVCELGARKSSPPLLSVKFIWMIASGPVLSHSATSTIVLFLGHFNFEEIC